MDEKQRAIDTALLNAARELQAAGEWVLQAALLAASPATAAVIEGSIRSGPLREANPDRGRGKEFGAELMGRVAPAKPIAEVDDGLWVFDHQPLPPRRESAGSVSAAKGRAKKSTRARRARSMKSAGDEEEDKPVPPEPSPEQRKLYFQSDLTAMFGFDPKTIRKWEQEGKFPLRIKLCGTRVAWFVSEVDDWLNSRPRGISGGKAPVPEGGQ